MTITILSPAAVNAELATIGIFKDQANVDAAPEPSIRKFEVGTVYSTRSICDHDCIFRWVVVKRTAKSVWLQSVGGPELKPYGDVTRRSITKHYSDNAELVYPSGKYSMCPILTADKKEA